MFLLYSKACFQPANSGANDKKYLPKPDCTPTGENARPTFHAPQEIHDSLAGGCLLHDTLQISQTLSTPQFCSTQDWHFGTCVIYHVTSLAQLPCSVKSGIAVSIDTVVTTNRRFEIIPETRTHFDCRNGRHGFLGYTA